MAPITSNLQLVRQRIATAAHAAQRDPDGVHLLAVSKRQTAAAMRAAYAAGQRDFGESYVQEALSKQAELTDLPITWHFIGPLQSNKTKAVAENFDWVHSVDNLKLAERLSAQRPADRAPLNLCLQVNISAEPSKSGCTPAQAVAFAPVIAGLPGLRLRGLMAIPAPADDLDTQRQPLRALRNLYTHLCDTGLPLDTLSMGMSDDLEAAILEGATWVRVGTAIFGARA